MNGNELSRRSMLMASALVPPLTSASACAQADPAVYARKTKTLVAFFSRSGNTRVIAGTLKRDLEADLFEIRPARAYPNDYEATVEQARQERDRNYEPPLEARVSGISAYDTLYLGFPIWGETAPPVIRTFLRAHTMEGKSIMPFITHGGYGVGSSLSVIASHAPEARIKTPFVLEADQERRTIDNVRKWLSEIIQR